MKYRHRITDKAHPNYGEDGNSVRLLPNGLLLFELRNKERIEIPKSSLSPLRCNFTRPEQLLPPLPLKFPNNSRNWDEG